MKSNSLLSITLLILLTAIAPALWGTTYIVTTELLPADRPFIAAFLRLLPAGIILVLISRHLPQRHEWLHIIILAILNFAIFHVLLFVAAYRLPGGLAAVVGAIQPLMMMFLIWFVDNRKPAHLALGASIVGVFGMAALLLSPSSTWDLVGILAAATGAMLMTSGVFLARRWRTDMPLLAFTGWQLLIAGIMLAPLAWLIDPPLLSLTSNNILGYGYLSLFGTTLAYVLWFNGIAKLSPVAVSSVGLLSPISAVIIGWLVLGQSITGTALIGLIAVLASVLTVQWALVPKQPQISN
jgi:probable blue pigment (indigoidine) exporter